VKDKQDDEATGKAMLLAKYERQQRLVASSDDPEQWRTQKKTCGWAHLKKSH
jgi:hypothetical protein